MSDQGEGAIKGLGIFSSLQAATKVRFFLLAASFVLLVDDVFLYLGQPGLFDLVAKKETLEASNLTLKVILIFVAFSFLSSLVLPILNIFFDLIISLTVFRLKLRIESFMEKIAGSTSGKIERDDGCVFSSELKKKAHETMEKYYLDLYKEHKKEIEEEQEESFFFAKSAFSCLVMLLFNIYIGYKGSTSISEVLKQYFDSGAPIGYAVFALLVMAGYRFLSTFKPKQIYCPNLHKELEEKERK